MRPINPTDDINPKDEAAYLEWELERRKDQEALRFFTPNGAQKRFVNEFKKPGRKIIIFSAGNGVGKTAIAITLLGKCIWPEYCEKEPFTGYVVQHWNDTHRFSPKYPKRARIISTSKEIEEIGSVQQEIKRWWPKGRYHSEKSGKTYASRYRTDNNWLVDIMSYDMDPSQFEGATIGFFLFNEPPPKEIYGACIARMRKGGRMVMPMTPLYDAGWIQDDLIDKLPPQRLSVVTGDIEENCITHGENGILEHEVIEEMLENYDEDEMAARAHGKFMHLANRIYTIFDRHIHVAKEEIEPPPSLEIETVQAVDPHIGRPFAIIYAYILPSGEIRIYDEWPDFDFSKAKESRYTVSDYVNIFKQKERARAITTRIMDRHYGNNRDLRTGQTIKQDFLEHNIEFLDSYSCGEEVETGILKVKQFMRWDKSRPIDNLNKPRIIISPKCKNLIRSVEKWCRDMNNGQPKEEWKDFNDTLRYLCAYIPSGPVHHMYKPWTKGDNYNTSDPFNVFNK